MPSLPPSSRRVAVACILLFLMCVPSFANAISPDDVAREVQDAPRFLEGQEQNLLGLQPSVDAPPVPTLEELAAAATTGPNLAVRGIELRQTAAGVAVLAEVANDGFQAAVGIDVRFSVYPVVGPAIFIATVPDITIPAGASQAVPVQWPTWHPGLHSFEAFADSANEATEVSEGDNLLQQRAVVPMVRGPAAIEYTMPLDVKAAVFEAAAHVEITTVNGAVEIPSDVPGQAAIGMVQHLPDQAWQAAQQLAASGAMRGLVPSSPDVQLYDLAAIVVPPSLSLASAHAFEVLPSIGTTFLRFFDSPSSSSWLYVSSPFGGPAGAYTLGSTASVQLADRAMKISLLSMPAAPSSPPDTRLDISNEAFPSPPATRTLVAAPPAGNLVLGFDGVDHSGQQVRLNRKWLDGMGLWSVRFTNDDGHVLPFTEDDDAYYVEMPHFSTMTASFASSADGFTKEAYQTYSEISWSSSAKALRVMSYKDDPWDEVVSRSLGSTLTTAQTISMSATWRTTQHGDGQFAIPIFIGGSSTSAPIEDGNAAYLWYESGSPSALPVYHLGYIDRYGNQRIHAHCTPTSLSGPTYTFRMTYSPSSRVMTLALDEGSTTCGSGSYTVTSSSDFSFTKVGVTTYGYGGSITPAVIGYTDNVAVSWTTGSSSGAGGSSPCTFCYGPPSTTTTSAPPPSPTAPVAHDGAYTLNEDTSKTMTLSATSAATATYSIVRNPYYGTVSGSGATRTYTPTANYNGADSFTFKACAGSLCSNVGTVTLTIAAVNDPPVANFRVVSQTGIGGYKVSVDAVNYAPDVTKDADDPTSTLTFTWNWDDGSSSPGPTATHDYACPPPPSRDFNIRLVAKDPSGASSAPFQRTVTVTNANTDTDLLGNCREGQIGTNPTNPDTDGDGLMDHEEDQGWNPPHGPGATPADMFPTIGKFFTDPNRWDSDGDGLGDKYEAYDLGTYPTNKAQLASGTMTTALLAVDRDGDGVNDRHDADPQTKLSVTIRMLGFQDLSHTVDDGSEIDAYYKVEVVGVATQDNEGDSVDNTPTRRDFQKDFVFDTPDDAYSVVHIDLIDVDSGVSGADDQMDISVSNSECVIVYDPWSGEWYGDDEPRGGGTSYFDPNGYGHCSGAEDGMPSGSDEGEVWFHAFQGGASGAAGADGDFLPFYYEYDRRPTATLGQFWTDLTPFTPDDGDDIDIHRTSSVAQGDGLTNLQEYKLGLDPLWKDVNAMPLTIAVNGPGDATWKASLKEAVQQANDLLWDLTDGRFLFGPVKVQMSASTGEWDDADVRIWTGTNTDSTGSCTGGGFEAGTAWFGGIQSGGNDAPIEMPYLVNGHNPGDDIWPNMLVHEWGHFAFFLHEEYVQFDNGGHGQCGAWCPPSIMGASAIPNPRDATEFSRDADYAAGGPCNQDAIQWRFYGAAYNEPAGTAYTPEQTGLMPGAPGYATAYADVAAYLDGYRFKDAPAPNIAPSTWRMIFDHYHDNTWPAGSAYAKELDFDLDGSAGSVSNRAGWDGAYTATAAAAGPFDAVRYIPTCTGC
ncbi:MAG: large repetitive protein [Thermoplasmata archaeon]|jgi:hypothetical protein|nr:large repetitive protein [Thermoplasmata archaeon]